MRIIKNTSFIKNQFLFYSITLKFGQLRKSTSLIRTLHFCLDYGEEKKKKPIEEPLKAGKEENSKSQEEKRKHIKSLIDKIPTDKNALFGYQLDWAVIDNVSYLTYPQIKKQY